MASGVATVWLPVKEMKRALGFYGETLGLEGNKSRTSGPSWMPTD